LDFYSQEKSLQDFDELMELERIEEVQQLCEEKKYLLECEVLQAKLVKLKDTLNY
jgi:hypothetical protein